MAPTDLLACLHPSLRSGLVEVPADPDETLSDAQLAVLFPNAGALLRIVTSAETAQGAVPHDNEGSTETFLVPEGSANGA